MTTVTVDEGITAVDDGFLIALYVFGAVGALFVLRFVSRALGGFYRYCLRCDPGLRKRYAGANWAVVTGATDGIGKAAAFRLASEGFNVALVSRTQAKLDAVADELKAKYPGTQTRVLAARFGSDDKTCVPRCEALIRELGADLAVLVNNVGIGDPVHHMWMAGTEGTRPTPDSYDVELEVNCRVATRLSVAALQVMIPSAHASKARRGILITGSLAYKGMPLQSVYGGTKAYVDILAKGLHTEVVKAGHPIDVTMYHPGSVRTNLAASLIPDDFNGIPEWSFATPEAVAKGALSALGHNDTVTYAVAKHAFLCWAAPSLGQTYSVVIGAMSAENKANGLSKTLGGLVGGGAGGAAEATT